MKANFFIFPSSSQTPRWTTSPPRLRVYNPQSDGGEISLSDKPAAFSWARLGRLILIDRGGRLSSCHLSRQFQCPKGESLSRLKTTDRLASSVHMLRREACGKTSRENFGGSGFFSTLRKKIQNFHFIFNAPPNKPPLRRPLPVRGTEKQPGRGSLLR